MGRTVEGRDNRKEEGTDGRLREGETEGESEVINFH